MFSQQKRATIKSLASLMNSPIELSKEVKSPELPFRHPKWKLALVEPVFQSQLGVVPGDTIILRKDMLSRPIACVVADYYPISDIGMNVIRLSDFAKQKLNCETNIQILVEKWGKIFGQ